jgi:hypothetical protein
VMCESTINTSSSFTTTAVLLPTFTEPVPMAAYTPSVIFSKRWATGVDPVAGVIEPAGLTEEVGVSHALTLRIAARKATKQMPAHVLRMLDAVLIVI